MGRQKTMQTFPQGAASQAEMCKSEPFWSPPARDALNKDDIRVRTPSSLPTRALGSVNGRWRRCWCENLLGLCQVLNFNAAMGQKTSSSGGGVAAAAIRGPAESRCFELQCSLPLASLASVGRVLLRRTGHLLDTVKRAKSLQGMSTSLDSVDVTSIAGYVKCGLNHREGQPGLGSRTSATSRAAAGQPHASHTTFATLLSCSGVTLSTGCISVAEVESVMAAEKLRGSEARQKQRIARQSCDPAVPTVALNKQASAEKSAYRLGSGQLPQSAHCVPEARVGQHIPWVTDVLAVKDGLLSSANPATALVEAVLEIVEVRDCSKFAGETQ
ncbi:hypothetical protein Micbo1qcDRAFT_222822 [Microdochium bolleyi]|uniref:Uncharacterized protein n=1 Tax=Microdochium bolleyi TaxID=196109 RepID=A0A136J7J9_9PEZI|nr:hypothetical protein Micbo1qcDRAFT_222822 [Microdochium bolleyi]